MRIAECGFDPFERDDGLHSEGPGGKYDPREPRYNAWLRELGYASDNPWEECANSGEDEDGNLLSGWLLRNSTRARVSRAFRDAIHHATCARLYRRYR